MNDEDVTLELLREMCLDIACTRDAYVSTSLAYDSSGAFGVYECKIVTDDIGYDFENHIYYDDMTEAPDGEFILFELLAIADTEQQVKASMYKRLLAIRDAIDGKTSCCEE